MRIWHHLPVPGCSINKTSRPQQCRIRKDAMHVLHTGPYKSRSSHIHTLSRSGRYICLHGTAQIPGVSQAQPEHYYQLQDCRVPFIKPHLQRDTEEGSGRIDSRDHTRRTQWRKHVVVCSGGKEKWWGEAVTRKEKKDWWQKGEKERNGKNEEVWEQEEVTRH